MQPNNSKNNIKKAKDATSKEEALRYKAEADKWSDGGIYKIGLHTLVGVGIGQFTGNGMATGAVAAGMNEALQPVLGQIKNEELHKLASLVVGNVVTGQTFGGATALNATTYNWLNHADQQSFASAFWNADSQEERSDIIAFYAALDNFNDAIKPGEGDNTIEADLIHALRTNVAVEAEYGLTYNLHKALTAYSDYYSRYEGLGFAEPYEYSRYLWSNGQNGFRAPWRVRYYNQINEGSIPNEVVGPNNLIKSVAFTPAMVYPSGNHGIMDSLQSTSSNSEPEPKESNSDKYLDTVTNISTTVTLLPFELGSVYAELPNVTKGARGVALGVGVGINVWRNSQEYSGKGLWKATAVDTTGDIIVAETGAVLTQLLTGDIKTTAKVTFITVEGVNLWRIWHENNSYDNILTEIKNFIAEPDKEETER